MTGLWRTMLAGALVLGACDGASTQRPPAPAQAGLAADTGFASLVQRLSGRGGYFDTDNLISNERSYLHVLPALERLSGQGGAYLGVGPDQSFSYIAAARPQVAFIVDIRSDNLLQHLLYKAIFELSPTRADFLAHLFGRALPHGPVAPADEDVNALMARLDSAAPDRSLERLHERIRDQVVSYGVPLSRDDLATVRRFHTEFMDAGPDLRFRSHGRAPRPYYPTYRQLVLERDRDGRQASFLASAEAYGIVRDLQARDRVVPVVGDLAGQHALPEIGRYLEELEVGLTVLYASNVEFYLWRDRAFDRFAANVARMPLTPGALLVRSVFRGAGRAHPHNVPGYYATQSLQSLESLLERQAGGGYVSYRDLVTRDAFAGR